MAQPPGQSSGTAMKRRSAPSKPMEKTLTSTTSLWLCPPSLNSTASDREYLSGHLREDGIDVSRCTSSKFPAPRFALSTKPAIGVSPIGQPSGVGRTRSEEHTSELQ